MTNWTIDKFSRLQGYPEGTIAPEVAELQSAINSLAQLDSRLSRALNRAVTHMVEVQGRDPDVFAFYSETMDDFIAEGDAYFSHYVNLVNEWEEYAVAVQTGEFEGLEPYEKILTQIERIKNLDI